MGHKISGLFFGSILLFVIITSGCVEYKDGILSINLQNVTEEMPEIRMPELRQGVDINIIDVNRSICAEKSFNANTGFAKYPCSKVVLNIKNNKAGIIHSHFNIARIVTIDGEQINPVDYRGGMDVHYYSLVPNAQENITINFPVIYMKQNPKLFIETGDHVDKGQYYEFQTQDTYNLDLTPYLED